MTKQLNLNLYKGKRGGRRPSSGRPRIHSKGVAHRKREKVNLKTPLHINFKLNLNVRTKERLKILKKAIVKAREQGLNIIHYSLQSNHVHLIVETMDNKTLTKGMRSLTITFSKNIKRGQIQKERYHLHVLRTPRETKNAITYVLFNQQKHTRSQRLRINEYASVIPYRMALNYAKSEGLTLIWCKQEAHSLDLPRTYLSRKALEQLVI